MNYHQLFATAWSNYQQLSERRHGILEKNFTRGWFTELRHTDRELKKHPASQLHILLNQYHPEDPKLKEEVIKYLLENPPKNTHSFSSYLIDELMTHDPDGGWELFEREPIITFSHEDIPLYRGVKYSPVKAFSEGLQQHYTSTYLDSYTSSQNGGIGNSTSLNYNIALDYAAPKQEPDPELRNAMMHCKKLGGTSYIYVIHYRGHKAIDIPNTHLARNNLLQYTTCAHEVEVNIAEDILSADIYCAIEIDRGTRSVKNRLSNPNYVRDENTNDIEQQYLTNKNLTLFSSNAENHTLLINNLTVDNVYVNLLKLSKEYIKIKYDTKLSEFDKNNKLKLLRSEVYTAFTKLLDTLNDDMEKSKLIHTAIKLKIFSEHKKVSLSNSIFNSTTKAQELLLNSIPPNPPLKTANQYPTRVIL